MASLPMQASNPAPKVPDILEHVECNAQIHQFELSR
eukprot:CAMPEP_0202815656 /NCGR_PEP_ID=MMETSP1389-20130828/6392_1 /ASSEMBLY_ACC=CAM_ASM_000865 /TAXON_ID=302021 /ORGANISM="Rhodomonas sp., Strain CCMP768" /LENGTH=35 /DNA_ID= /DNA_START= /DNA_END= /DNA_ORIENTATION=